MTLPVLTIKSARIRLTLMYLSIIFVLAAGFSTAFYFQSVNEAKGNLAGQQVQLKDFLFFISPERIQSTQDRQLQAFKSNLQRQLVGLNLAILAVGSVVSYYLAGRSLKPLAEALAQQGRFTSDAAHELRTPLTAMKAETEVALRSRKLSIGEAKEVLRSNLEEIGKLDALTSALLRLARSSEMIDTSNWQDYKLQDILNAARDRLSSKAASRGITISIPKTKAVIHGDPDLLVELFVPLIGNAVKYSHDDSQIELKVSVGDLIKVDVIDHGVGIASQDLPHIFERFYRADAARSREGTDGYGLGLSLAESIVLAHVGEIRVKSTPGKGSTFTVYLPKA